MTASVKEDKQAGWVRDYQRVRARALVRLREAHLAEYKKYLSEERARDKENNNSTDITDTIVGNQYRTYSYKDTIEGGGEQANDSSENQSNYGGEE